MNVAFTGHRDFDRGLYGELLYRRILALTRGGGVVFLSGMAVGFDLTAAEYVLELRDRGAPIKLCCVVPYVGQSLFYNSDDVARYDSVLRRADRVVTLSDHYSRDVYFRRNDYLIAHSDHILAYHNGGKQGGTAYTLRAARRKGLPVDNIYPQSQLSLF